MLCYLDSVVAIHTVDGTPADRVRAVGHLAALRSAGHRFVISDLVRAECLVPVVGVGGPRLARLVDLFHNSNLRTVGLAAAVFERAAAIRGGHRYPAVPPAQPRRYLLTDALHLAAAIEAGCDVFSTNDHRLDAFPDIAVEVLL